jgi:hypothetical protein
MTEELDEGIGKLVPEFALPEVLEIKYYGLEFFGSFIALFGKKVGNRIDVHCWLWILHRCSSSVGYRSLWSVE